MQTASHDRNRNFLSGRHGLATGLDAGLGAGCFALAVLSLVVLALVVLDPVGWAGNNSRASAPSTGSASGGGTPKECGRLKPKPSLESQGSFAGAATSPTNTSSSGANASGANASGSGSSGSDAQGGSANTAGNSGSMASPSSGVQPRPCINPRPPIAPRPR